MSRSGVAIIGAAESDLGYTPELSPLEVMAQASHRALANAGIALRDVDAIFTASAQITLPSVRLAEYLGISPRYMDSTVHGGSSNLSHIRHAIGAINSGLCEVALVAYGSTQRSELKRTGKRPVVASLPDIEEPYAPLFPISSYALIAQRHMFEFGTTRDQLAEVAVAASQWASLNPNAFRRTALSIEDVVGSPMVSSPLRVNDCCLITDGGGAVVVVSSDRARSVDASPVFVLGTGEMTEHEGMTRMPNLTTTGAVRSGKQAFEEAGLGPEDVDVFEIYDAFTINPIVVLEDLGFCKKGYGGQLFEQGNAGPGGNLALNTSGGGLSYTHPGMFGMFALIEAVRQLRGECGNRQVDVARIALAHGIGGTMSTHTTVILAAE
jgi:acetyl-CoA acetyltransferase